MNFKSRVGGCIPIAIFMTQISIFRLLQSIHPATSAAEPALPNSTTPAAKSESRSAAIPSDGDAGGGCGERRHRRLPRQDGQRRRGSATVLISSRATSHDYDWV